MVAPQPDLPLGRGLTIPSAELITAQEHRSQWRNRQAAQERLVSLLEEAIRPPAPPRRRTRPTKGSVERRLATKKLRSSVKGQRRARPSLPDD